MIDELEWLRRERPEAAAPSTQARAAAERALSEAIADGAPARRGRGAPPWTRLRLAPLAPIVALLVAVAVVAVFLGGPSRKPSGPSALVGPELVFRAQPAGPVHVVKVGAVGRAASIIQQLVSSLPGAAGQVAVRATGDRIVVSLGGASSRSMPELLSLLDTTGRFVFYDWEADALTPSGHPVASLLTRQDPSALQISQGGGSAAPGSPGAGSLSLYAAVSLASRQSQQVSADNGRPGPEYFAFGRPGGAACSAAASAYRTRLVPGGHCYLAGPAPSRDQTLALLPAGVSPAAATVIRVPQGAVVLQAEGSGGGQQPSLSDPAAQFYVLRDHAALLGLETIKPAPGVDQSGLPNVSFGFTAKGAAAFQAVTARVAHRGDQVSSIGQTFNQHFAVALGDRLAMVASIDSKSYPDGIPGGNGADLVAGGTGESARRLTAELALGALPLALTLVSSATAGG